METNDRKAYGAYASAVVRKLRACGLQGKALETAIGAVKARPQKAVKFPLKVRKVLGDTLLRDGKAVVTYRGGGFKVYSVDGYQRLQAGASKNCRANKPWLARAAKEAAGAAK